MTAVSAARIPLLVGSSWGTSVSVEGFEYAPDVDANSRFKPVRTPHPTIGFLPIHRG